MSFVTPRREFLLIGGLSVAVYAGLFAGITLISPRRRIAIFDSGVPGSPESYEALQFAYEAGIDDVINYSSVNSDAAARDTYLKYAEQLGVNVIVSVKDFVGPVDHDPDNQHFHAQYGSTNGDRVMNIAQTFDSNPYAKAVWGYFVADEPEGKELTYADVRVRHDQIKSVSSKPTMSSYWRFNKDELALRAQGSDHLMMDFYPYPEGPNQTYGKVEDIESIARDMKSVAGHNSWFALQAFSYQISEPPLREKFNFPIQEREANFGAPGVDVMVDMASRALQGGVQNLAIFSYGYAKQLLDQEGIDQLNKIKLAVSRIRALPEFINPSYS